MVVFLDVGTDGFFQFGCALEHSALEPAAGQQGAGIRLFIVRRLCELLGARLSIETGLESGTVFTVALPRRYAA